MRRSGCDGDDGKGAGALDVHEEGARAAIYVDTWLAITAIASITIKNIRP
jgi:hypothetical protein